MSWFVGVAVDCGNVQGSARGAQDGFRSLAESGSTRERLLSLLLERLPAFERVDEVLTVLLREWPDLFRETPQPAVDASNDGSSPTPSAATEREGLARQLEKVEETNAGLLNALTSNREIGAACGILMAQRRLTYEAAFDELRRHSQQTHRKLRDVAADVLFVGDLLDEPR